MKPHYFASPAEWRAWLMEHHAATAELLAGFYKVGSGRPSSTWPGSVDPALCFGWIDGVRRSIDEQRYTIRFTPRRAASVWSAVNSRRVAELINAGLMQPSGLKALEARKEQVGNLRLRATISRWVISAKKEETRQRRLKALSADSARGLIIQSMAKRPSATS